MKFLLTFVVCFMAFVAVGFAADCNVAGHDLDLGEKYSPPGICAEFRCIDVGVAVPVLNCAYSSTPPGCKYVPENLKKRYPHCCSRNIC